MAAPAEAQDGLKRGWPALNAMQSGRPIALVIGTGQLGQELARLRSDAFLVKVIGRDVIDVTNALVAHDTIKKTRPIVVLNASAYTAVDKAEAEPAAAFAVNRDGAAALAIACDDLATPLIHVSTDYVFDGDNGPYTETSKVGPRSVYGDSKLQGEIEIRNRLERHVILRTAWLFSSFGNNFVKTMLRLAATKREISVVDDQFGCPTPAAALAGAMIRLAEIAVVGDKFAWGTYHFAGQPTTTWCRFAETIFARATMKGLIDAMPKVIPITTAQYPTAARRPANSVLDCESLAELGLTAPDWAASLDAVLDELQHNRVAGSALL